MRLTVLRAPNAIGTRFGEIGMLRAMVVHGPVFIHEGPKASYGIGISTRARSYMEGFRFFEKHRELGYASGVPTDMEKRYNTVAMMANSGREF